MKEYLAETYSIDFHHPEIQRKVHDLQTCSKDSVEYVKRSYYFVRDEIPHSWDIMADVVSKRASDVLINKTGICWTKACLLAALLRANKIPAGISYQLLTRADDGNYDGYIVHALNTVYISEASCWIRLDARGNKDNIHAEFSLDDEQLAYSIRTEFGEHDLQENHPDLDERLVKILEGCQNIKDISTDFTDL